MSITQDKVDRIKKTEDPYLSMLSSFSLYTCSKGQFYANPRGSESINIRNSHQLITL